MSQERMQRANSDHQGELPRPPFAKSYSMFANKGPCYSCHRDQDPLDNIIGCTKNPNVSENCQAKRLAEGKECPKPCTLEHGHCDPCLDKVHHFVKGPNHSIKYQDHRDHDIVCDEIIGQTPLPANHFSTHHTHGGHSVALPSKSSVDSPNPAEQKTRVVEERKEIQFEHSGPKHVEHTTMASLPGECKEKDAKAWQACLEKIKNEGDVSHLVHGFQDSEAPANVQTVKIERTEEIKESAAGGKKELQTKASFPTENKANDTKAWEACLKAVHEDYQHEHPGSDAKGVSDFKNGTIEGRREEGVGKKESELAAKGELKKEVKEGKSK